MDGLEFSKNQTSWVFLSLESSVVYDREYRKIFYIFIFVHLKSWERKNCGQEKVELLVRLCGLLAPLVLKLRTSIRKTNLSELKTLELDTLKGSVREK